MKFPPDSGGSPSATGAGGYWDGFLNGDDSFHKVINMLDFPLESVEEDKCVTRENWNAQFQSLGPMTSEILQGFAPMFKSDDIPNNFVQIDATSDTKQLQVVTEISSTHVPLNSSHLTNTRLFRTPSPSSVIESSSSCSAGKNMSVGLELLVPVRTRTKILRSSTFTRWHMLLPVTVTPREISNSKDKEKKEMKPSHSPNECDMEENSCRRRMPCKRCTHCQTQKTPQWREGPMGPKTLCNACGVRYLSGRLVPEYRPAASYQAIKLPKINGNVKKKKKKIKLSGILKDNQMKEKSTYEQIRRCANCRATETPQWREGPMGPKTLCNACGVRYRSESKKTEKINTRSQEKNMGWSGLPNEVAIDQRTPCKRCAHCQVTKTPQWREGPMGPKTLCNACGVRYRSGRLMPEYRPAASPTFVPTLHSNLHKQVIRMRKSHTEKTVEPKMDPEMSPPPDFVPMSSCYLYDN